MTYAQVFMLVFLMLHVALGGSLPFMIFGGMVAAHFVTKTLPQAVRQLGND